MTLRVGSATMGFPYNVSTFDHFTTSTTGRPPSSTTHSQVLGEGVARGAVGWEMPLVIGVLGLLSAVLISVVAKQNPEAARRLGRFLLRSLGRLSSMFGRQPDEGGDEYEAPDDPPALPLSQRPLANRTDSDRLRRCSVV